ncbi:MAG: hypothetical protein OJJ21_15740 [Ferrovibrio sp.]|uniref:hypothetical protein n=1 Tax=Ferrovibrio sp. TaxID=1917215 RepID=UPI002634152B|nr:hypothetical protein [Ferrovibrio sp.]MCW0235053.1 hypothetical protein [Ferrovibrio sp.]
MSAITVQHQNGQLTLQLPEDFMPAEDAVQLLDLFQAASPAVRAACLQALSDSPDQSIAAEKSATVIEVSDLPADENRYITLILKTLRQRDNEAICFAHADLFALTEAERLGLPLTARQRNTLIQYYVARQPDNPVQQSGGGSSLEAALGRAAALAERIRKKQ